ncbi:hypothetical protein LP414_32270 [Polaromonas sp. P1(28)-13]|nr:hypothetical protein LP414_32270 [Polaromonas sp. P1(28)-13]
MSLDDVPEQAQPGGIVFFRQIGADGKKDLLQNKHLTKARGHAKVFLRKPLI